MKKILFGAIILLAASSCSKKTPEADAFGHFEADEYNIMAESGGRLVSWTVDDGCLVSFGDTIGIVDTMHFFLQKELLTKQVASIRSKLTVIQAQEEALDLEININKRELARFALMLAEDAVSQKTIDDLTDRIAISNARKKGFSAEKFSVMRELEVVDTQRNQIDDQIRRSVILSPVTGSVISCYVNKSDMVVPGKNLATVADLSVMYMKGYISGDQLYQAKPGGMVVIQIDGPEGDVFEYDGSITWISDEAEFTPKVIQTRKERVHLVYALKIRVINDGRIRIGMPGELYFSK